MEKHCYDPVIAKLWRTFSSSSEIGLTCNGLQTGPFSLWTVSSNWSTIDLMRCMDPPRCSPQARVSAGQPSDSWVTAARETRDGAGEHASSPHVLCACPSRPFLLDFFSGAACGSPSSNFACPNDAWRRQTADPLSLLFNRLYPAYCMSITCFFF